MADFLTRLSERTLGSASVTEPVVAPMYAPEASMEDNEPLNSALEEEPPTLAEELPVDADEVQVTPAPEIVQFFPQTDPMPPPLVPQEDAASATPTVRPQEVSMEDNEPPTLAEELPVDADEVQVTPAPEIVQPFSQTEPIPPPLVPQEDAASATPTVRPQEAVPQRKTPESQLRSESPQVEHRWSRDKLREIPQSGGSPAPHQSVVLGPLEQPVEEEPLQAMEGMLNFGEASSRLSDPTPQPSPPDAGVRSDRRAREDVLEESDSPSRLVEKVEDGSEEETPPVQRSTESARIPVEPLVNMTKLKQERDTVMPPEHSLDTELEAPESQIDADLSNVTTTRRDHEVRPDQQENAFTAQPADTSVQRPLAPREITPEVTIPREQIEQFWADRRGVAPERRESAPTIQVTIGRVEVRANMPPPPPPRSKNARPGPALSLDDYLKQRNGGKS